MHLYCMLIRIHHLHVVHVIYIHNGNLEEVLTIYMHTTTVVAIYYIHLPSIYNIYNIQTLSFLFYIWYQIVLPGSIWPDTSTQKTTSERHPNSTLSKSYSPDPEMYVCSFAIHIDSTLAHSVCHL